MISEFLINILEQLLLFLDQLIRNSGSLDFAVSVRVVLLLNLQLKLFNLAQEALKVNSSLLIFPEVSNEPLNLLFANSITDLFS